MSKETAPQHYEFDDEDSLVVKPKKISKVDFSNEPLLVNPDKVDLGNFRTYLNDKSIAIKAVNDVLNGELDELVAKASNPGVSGESLNDLMIKRYQNAFVNKNDYELNKIIANKNSKPAEVQAARNLMRDRNRIAQKEKLVKVKEIKSS